MENNELTEMDYYLIKKLFVISKLILNNYYELVETEFDGNIDSKEYNTLKNELMIAIAMERELYGQIPTIDKAKQILDFVDNGEYIVFEDLIFSIFVESTIETYVVNRVISRLNYLVDINTYNYKIKNTSPDSNITNSIYLQINIENDIANTILVILNKYINDPKYDNIRFMLLEYKYLLINYFYDIEKNMLVNDFKISDNVIWSSKFVADAQNINDEIYRREVCDYCTGILSELRDHLLDTLIFKKEYIKQIGEYEYTAYIKIIEIIIRSVLLFTSDEIVNNFVNTLLSDFKENNIDTKLFTDTFDNYLNDQRLIMVLNLNR